MRTWEYDEFGIALLMLALAFVVGFIINVYVIGWAMHGGSWYAPHVLLSGLGVLSGVFALGASRLWWAVPLAICFWTWIVPGLLVEALLFAFAGAWVGHWLREK